MIGTHFYPKHRGVIFALLIAMAFLASCQADQPTETPPPTLLASASAPDRAFATAEVTSPAPSATLPPLPATPDLESGFVGDICIDARTKFEHPLDEGKIASQLGLGPGLLGVQAARGVWRLDIVVLGFVLEVVFVLVIVAEAVVIVIVIVIEAIVVAGMRRCPRWQRHGKRRDRRKACNEH